MVLQARDGGALGKLRLAFFEQCLEFRVGRFDALALHVAAQHPFDQHAILDLHAVHPLELVDREPFRGQLGVEGIFAAQRLAIVVDGLIDFGFYVGKRNVDAEVRRLRDHELVVDEDLERVVEQLLPFGGRDLGLAALE